MTTEEHALTAEDVEAIRAMAPRRPDHRVRYAIVADYRRDRGHAVTIIETREMPAGYEPSTVDRRYTIPAAGRNEIHADRGNVARYVASATVYGFEPDGIGRVLANVVRPGDTLTVRFSIGNDTDRMRDAGFTRDDCYLGVIRRGKVIASCTVDTQVSTSDGWTMADRHYRPERDAESA